MVRYIFKRFTFSVVMLLLLSIIVFAMAQLPPGDFADRLSFMLKTEGVTVTQSDMANLRHRLGLDKPWHIQYLYWMKNILLHGDFGISFKYREPVLQVIGERLSLTAIMTLGTVTTIYLIAIPLGIYSALNQYSPGDHLATIIGYVGLCIPNFILALILMYLTSKYLNISAGLFSQEYLTKSWSWGRVLDMLKHIWIPILVLAASGIAFRMRTMRATLLDEKQKLYVTAARAKGLSERKLMLKYPVRIAINPIVSTLGWELTRVISNSPIVTTVLSISVMGPLYLAALLDQDVYLSSTFLMMYSVLIIVGTFISDILLAILDPRVRRGVN